VCSSDLRYADPAFQRAFPEFSTEANWQREVALLGELERVIEEEVRTR
jgi:hypothetical protein